MIILGTNIVIKMTIWNCDKVLNTGNPDENNVITKYDEREWC